MIWKQVLELVDVQVIQVPVGAIILSAAEQNGNLCVWYQFVQESLPGQAVAQIEVRIVGTGNLGPGVNGFVFIDTVLMSNGLVWHVFCTYP